MSQTYARVMWRRFNPREEPYDGTLIRRKMPFQLLNHPIRLAYKKESLALLLSRRLGIHGALEHCLVKTPLEVELVSRDCTYAIVTRRAYIPTRAPLGLVRTSAQEMQWYSAAIAREVVVCFNNIEQEKRRCAIESRPRGTYGHQVRTPSSGKKLPRMH